jgi:hypothetical protein
MDVVAEAGQETVGRVAGILLNPDTAAVEGFFLFRDGEREPLFLAAADVRRFGTVLTVADTSRVSPVEDRVRLRPLLQDKRPVLGQRVRTERGRNLGICRDIQIGTRSMRMEWLFPKRFWRWGVALPASAITEITEAAIVIRDDAVMRSRTRRRLLPTEPVLPVVAVPET